MLYGVTKVNRNQLSKANLSAPGTAWWVQIKIKNKTKIRKYPRPTAQHKLGFMCIFAMLLQCAWLFVFFFHIAVISKKKILASLQCHRQTCCTKAFKYRYFCANFTFVHFLKPPALRCCWRREKKANENIYKRNWPCHIHMGSNKGKYKIYIRIYVCVHTVDVHGEKPHFAYIVPVVGGSREWPAPLALGGQSELFH